MNTRRLMALATVVAAANVLAGFCENTTDDPRQGGYLGGICGINTGRYRQRLEDREKQIGELEGINAKLREGIGKARTETRELDSMIASTARRLEADRGAVASLAANLEQLAQTRKVSLQTLAALRQDVGEMRRELDSIRDRLAAKEGAARALRESVQMAASQRQLEQMIDKTRAGIEKIEQKTGDAR